jgi:hypothetical protein
MAPGGGGIGGGIPPIGGGGIAPGGGGIPPIGGGGIAPGGGGMGGGGIPGGGAGRGGAAGMSGGGAPICAPLMAMSTGNEPSATVPFGPISTGWCGDSGRPLSIVPFVDPRSVMKSRPPFHSIDACCRDTRPSLSNGDRSQSGWIGDPGWDRPRMTGNRSISTWDPSGAVRVIGYVPFMRSLTLATGQPGVNQRRPFGQTRAHPPDPAGPGDS